MDLVDHRRTQAPVTSLPALRLVLPEGDDGWASEFDRELKTPYSLGRFDPDTPAGTHLTRIQQVVDPKIDRNRIQVIIKSQSSLSVYFSLFASCHPCFCCLLIQVFSG